LLYDFCGEQLKIQFFQTSVSLASTLNMLARNQEKQEKLYLELKNALPDPNVPTTENVLAQMPFLRACVKETLRFELIQKWL